MCNKEKVEQLEQADHVSCDKEALNEIKDVRFQCAKEDKAGELANGEDGESETVSFSQLVASVEKSAQDLVVSLDGKRKNDLIDLADYEQTKARIVGTIDFVHLACDKVLQPHVKLSDLSQELSGHMVRLGIENSISQVNSLVEATVKQQGILTDFLGEIMMQVKGFFDAGKASFDSIEKDIEKVDVKLLVAKFAHATKNLEKEAKPAINKMVVFSSRLQYALECKIDVLAKYEKVAKPQATV